MAPTFPLRNGGAKDYYDYQCGNGQGYCCLVEKTVKERSGFHGYSHLQYSQDLF